MSFLQSHIPGRPLRLVIVVLIVLVLLFLMFEAGMAAGYRRAHISYRPHMGAGFPSARALPHVLLTGGPGAFGRITQVSGNTLTITTRDGGSRTITVSSSTEIRGEMSAASSSLSQLKPGEQIVAVGNSEDNGNMKAILVRILSMGTSSRMGDRQLLIKH